MVLAFGAAYMSSIITLVVLLSRLFRAYQPEVPELDSYIHS
jgi:hypothetical protein